MARVMFLDCFSGAAGDMLLGAFLDAGLPLDGLRAALGSLGVEHELRVSRVVRAGITATHVDVVDLHAHESETTSHAHGAAEPHAHTAGDHRTLAEIAALIAQSALSPAGQARAHALFRRLAEAEAAIHGVPLDAVHLHEVGALDSIIDIVAAVYAFEWFGVDEVVASPLNVGGGTVEIAHGTFPVPAPATMRLLSGAPIYSAGPQVELLTPTGALLISDYATSYGAIPALTVDRVGYGAGTKNFTARPNVVRVVIGERLGVPDPPPATDTVVKIECEIDDMNPQLFGHAMDRLFDAGALDVFFTSVIMKKGRPGTLVTVLATDATRGTMCDVLFRETSTIGVRFETMRRETLERRWTDVDTSGGVVRVKVSTKGGAVLNVAPEFDDCVRAAAAAGRPVKTVQAEALCAWWAAHSSS